MSISEVKSSILKSCFTANFLPAILREYQSGWIIEYYVENPSSHELERKKVRLNRLVSRYKSTKDARSHANKMVTALNVKLASGWNPFFSGEDVRLYTSVEDVCSAFLKEKEKESRKDTIRSYSSFVSIFSKWISSNVYVEYLSTVNKMTVIRFMDYVYNERNVSAISYNNYIKMGRALFNWAKEKCYVKENPFDFIKVKPKTEKQRTIIPEDYRKKITNYLLSSPEERNYLIALKLIYNSLLRISEVRRLKIENINLDDKIIIATSDMTKTHKKRIISLTDDLCNDLRSLNLEQYPKSYYLLGKGLKPSNVMQSDAYMRKYWERIRKILKLPSTMQQYSLRDTGIFEMLKSGIDPLSVKQHADHHSLEMTTIYSNHVDPNLANIIREKSPKF